jgi:glycosyltransferase involved in cell wall biosynthesis
MRRVRPRLAVALTFPVFPALGGGQVRVYNLYRELARSFDVELVTLARSGAPGRVSQLAPGLWERRVAKSAEHAEAEVELETRAGVVVTDVAMGRLHGLTPQYADALGTAARGAAAVVASHPYALAAIREATDVPLCYEAHNVEAALKADLLGGSPTGRDLLAEVEETEGRCCREARLVWTCSAEDRDALAARYGGAAEAMIVVPNGVALGDFAYTPPAARQELKRRLRISDRFTALFLASWHQPNVLAARRLVPVARATPGVDFLVIGSVGSALAEQPLPDNLRLTGAITAEHKQDVLRVADVALNPVTTGSGTNIKMLDYFASGLPVIASAFGARGLGVEAGVHFVRAEPSELPAALAAMRHSDPDRLLALAGAARAHVEQALAWPVIAAGLVAALSGAFGVPGGAAMAPV